MPRAFVDSGAASGRGSCGNKPSAAAAEEVTAGSPVDVLYEIFVRITRDYSKD